MKKVIIILLAFLAPIFVKGQDSLRFTNSNLFLEFGGAAGISANYEKLLPINELTKFSGRAGLGMYPSDLGLFGSEPRWSAVFPLMFNFIYGRTVALEAGLGVSIGFGDFIFEDFNDGLVKWYNGTLGLRYQKPEKGFLVRLGYTPIFIFPSICENSTCTETRREFSFGNGVGLSFGTRLKSR